MLDDVTRGAAAPRASVIIPVFDHRDGLRHCLDALARQRIAPDEFEVIVIDNDPSAGADERITELEKALVGFPEARVLHEPKRGSYAARNLGLAAATGEILAFTDADCEPGPDWIAAGAAYLDAHPDTAAVAGAIEVFTNGSRHRTGVELYELRHGFQQQKYVETAGFGATANMFARRAAFERIGAFDPTLRSGGDRDWGARLRQSGIDMGFEPAAVVRHPARQSLAELSSKISRVVDGDVVLRQRSGWSRLNWIRYSLKQFRPPLREIWRSRSDPRLRSDGEVLRYGVTFLAVRWITAGFRLRRLVTWPRPAERG